MKSLPFILIKNKIEKDNLKKIITKKTMRRDTVAIHNVLWAKYNAFPTWLSFITKLNSNQLNIKKNKIDEDNFGKKISQKKKTQKKLKKNYVRKNCINP